MFGGGFGGGFGSGFGGFQFGGFSGGVDQTLPTDGGFLASQNEAVEGMRGGSRPIYPFTVSLIRKSFQKNPQLFEAEFFGERVAEVRLVGLVRELNIDTMNEKWSFKLDDATGSIQVDWSVSDSRGYDEPGISPWMKENLDRIKENTYVSVRGVINTLGQSLATIMASSVKRVEIPEEIFFHQIEAAQQIVRKIASSPAAPSAIPAPSHHRPSTCSTTAGNSSEGASRFAQPPFGSVRRPFEQVGKRFDKQISFYETSRGQVYEPPTPQAARAYDISRGQVYEPPTPQAARAYDISRGQVYEPPTPQPYEPTRAYETSRAQPYEPTRAQPYEPVRRTPAPIIETLKAVAADLPEGMSVDDIRMYLLAKGTKVDKETLERECRALAQGNQVCEANGKWKLTR